jgi:HD-GYP domain-containing protein (c-di-GMP phosphodiesterase class II)
MPENKVLLPAVLPPETLIRLYEATQALAIQASLSGLQQAVVEQGQRVTESGFVMLYQVETERVGYKCVAQWPKLLKTNLSQPQLRDLAMQAAKTNKTVSGTVTESASASNDSSSTSALLAQPLLYNDLVTGVLIIAASRSDETSQANLALLELFATSAAALLDKAVRLDYVEQRLAHSKLIQKSQAEFAAALASEDILRILLDNILNQLSLSAGSIWLYDPAYDELVRAEYRGIHRQLAARNKPGVGVVGKVFVTGEAYPAREFKTGPLDPDNRAGSGQSNWGGLCVPLKVNTETVGVLFVTTQLPRELSASESALMVELSQIAGQVLQKSQQAVEPNRRVQRLNSLRTIDTAIATSLELPVILNVILDQVLARLGINAAVVLLLNSESQILEYAAGRGFYTDGVTRIRLRLSDLNALKQQSPITVDLAGDDHSPVRSAVLASERFVVYFTVPLLARGKVKGALEIYHRDVLEPDTEWYEFLETLAAQAALAIDNATLFAELRRSNSELALAYEATLQGWSKALDLRDHETEGHTRRVTEMTLRLARAMKIPEGDLTHIGRGALLHDIGKMGIPDSILLKPGPLTEDELISMHKHPKYAYDMLSAIAYLIPALDIPYCHHEKWDGTGYPRGLKGEQIPLWARIFAVVDVWDALRFDRPYRARWPESEVHDYIHSLSGKHFDPQIVAAFFRCLAEGN